MSKCFNMFMHVMPYSRTALKRAFEELTYNERVLDDDTFLKLMLKYQPLMRELHKMAQQVETFSVVAIGIPLSFSIVVLISSILTSVVTSRDFYNNYNLFFLSQSIIIIVSRIFTFSDFTSNLHVTV